MMTKIGWNENAWNDYCEWQEVDRKTLKRINALIKDIQRNPFDGIGKPENLKNCIDWSRRIDDKHRLVYTYDREKDFVVISSCKKHYDDK